MASRENVLKRRPVLLVFLFDQVGPIEERPNIVQYIAEFDDLLNRIRDWCIRMVY